MIYVKTSLVNGKKMASLIHYKPEQIGKNANNLDDNEMLVESLPVNVSTENQVATLLVDQNGNLYYEYEELNSVNEIEQLRLEMARNNAELFETMLSLVGGM